MKKATAVPTLICLAICLSLTTSAWAACERVGATCYPGSQSIPTLTQVDVQDCINNYAQAGDTVFLKAGVVSWASGVQITKGVTVQGAGSTSTVINGTGAVTFFQIPYTVSGGNYRITGLGLTGSSTGGTDLIADGNFASLRIDNLNITTSSTRSLWIGSQTLMKTIYGYAQNQKILIDHIQFTPGNGEHEFMLLYGSNTSWAEDDGFGTDNFVFIEDCTFNYAGYSSPITDSEYGGRFVFRNNSVTNSGGVLMHDTGSTPRSRGTRLTEIYNNTFSCTAGVGTCFTPVNFLRGGSGLFYNNTITGGYQFVNWPIIYRLGYADAWVSNTTCNASGSLKVCQDVVRHCASGAKAGYPCYDNYDCPSGTCGGYSCSSNLDCKKADGSTGLCMQLDGSGAGGYPCRDQMGRGKDDPTTGVQASAPAYWWNNTMNGSPVNPIIPSQYSSYIQENRDYCSHSPATSCGSKTAWTYAAYTYPHPLQSRLIMSPGNLRITP